MIGQMSIDGEELTGFVTVLPGLAAVEWPESEVLHRGDRLQVTVEYVVTHHTDGAPVDSRAIPKETVKRSYITAPDKSSVKVAGIVRKAQAEEVA